MSVSVSPEFARLTTNAPIPTVSTVMSVSASISGRFGDDLGSGTGVGVMPSSRGAGVGGGNAGGTGVAGAANAGGAAAAAGEGRVGAGRPGGIVGLGRPDVGFGRRGADSSMTCHRQIRCRSSSFLTKS